MTKAITASVNEKSTVGFDGVGRESQMQLNSDVPSTTYTLATYDALGRKSQVYNPTRCNPATTNCGETTWGFTTTNYDPLNRVTSVVEEDGSTVSTDYSAFPCTTVKDETGKVRKSCVDGLGRTTKVFEAPSGLNYETDYGYDALANLLRVTQKGGTTDSTQWRIRTYTYDSLSHLVCAANPEIRNVSCPSSPTGPFPSGTVLYAYDSDGNVVTKTAPSPNQASTGTSTVATNYTYDVLNRLTGKSYADTYVSNSATSGVQYGYDGVALSGCTTAPPSLTDSYPKGERTAMCDGSGATSWAHEVMGRVAIEKRTVVGTSAWSKSAGYTYNLDGSFATISNPGIGRVMTYTMTGAGRQKSVVNTGGGINFVTNATYAPAGELATYTNGSNINTTNSYNGRFQPATLSAVNTSTGQTIISLTYDFHSSTHADNGNVFQIVNGKDGNRTQNFLYDSLNRIQQAYTNGTNWGETFGPTATAPGTLPSSPGIDAWGNLTNRSGVTGKSSSELLSVAPASNQNRLPGFGYDAAGNMISNGSASYTYDAENHLLTTAGWTYVYDGDGRRVRKSSGSTGTLYWPDLNGNVLNESSLGATNLHEYVYFGGKRVARIDVPTPLTVKYFFSDQLGSADVITDASGSILEESDYFPYGGEIAITNNDGNNYKFTGKERDAETCTTGCLDYFGARHHASSLGRFQMPDAFYKDSHVADPQSWNEYAYARNNPMRYVDPNGEKADVSTSCTTTNTQTTCNVNVSASIAVYSANGANLSQPQLDDAASQIQSSIQNAWSGSFTQDGVTYNVTTQISVSVAGSEADAMKNGAQNVIGLSNGNASATGDSYVNSRSLFSAITGRGPDTGVFNINSLAEGVAAHEFTHLLGVENKPGAVLSNTNILNDPTVPHSATASDFRWGIREAILGVNGWMNAPQNRPMRYGELWDKPSAYSGQSTVSAPWHWWK
jgi:RHS repeat-associated protein